MGVEFFKDSAEEDRWRVADDEEIIHSCHEGFSNKHNALQNLFLNHAMMSVFVSGFAGSGSNPHDVEKRIQFFRGSDERVWWRIKGGNGGIIGKSHKGFDSRQLAVDNMIMTYTMLSMFIALHAQENNK